MKPSTERMALKPPVKLFGAKSKLAKRLLQLIPLHHIYVEHFGGSAALLFAKNSSPVEVYNDIDSGLYNLFCVLRDPWKNEELQRVLSLTLYSREDYYACRDNWHLQEDDVERARQYMVALNMAVSGELGKGWSHTIRESLNQGTVAGCPWRWLSRIEIVPLICARLRTVQIENLDWRITLTKYDTPETLHYLDPPYMHLTRKSGRYRHELSDQDHEELVEMILSLKGMVLLSGYRSALYEQLERNGWLRRDFESACHAAGPNTSREHGPRKSKPQRVESVWLSPSLQEALNGQSKEVGNFR